MNSCLRYSVVVSKTAGASVKKLVRNRAFWERAYTCMTYYSRAETTLASREFPTRMPPLRVRIVERKKKKTRKNPLLFHTRVTVRITGWRPPRLPPRSRTRTMTILRLPCGLESEIRLTVGPRRMPRIQQRRYTSGYPFTYV